MRSLSIDQAAAGFSAAQGPDHAGTATNEKSIRRQPAPWNETLSFGRGEPRAL